MRRLFSVVVLVSLIAGGFAAFPAATGAQGGDNTLTIIHTNDSHAHIAQFTKYGGACTEEDAAQGACLGGVARRKMQIDSIRAEGGNSILVDAGDQFQGTLFYIQYKGEEAKQFMNEMGYAGMAVGNHEFDDGPGNLATFAKGLDFPLLSANIDTSGNAELDGLIKPYTIVEVGGQQIGLVGATTTETAHDSSPGPTIVFNDVKTSVEAAVLELEAKGVDKIVLLSHIGYLADQALAAELDGVDVIVGGHSHTLLINQEGAAGPYPTVVQSPSGDPVLIVQVGAWSSYLGRLDVTFDANGKATAWQGDPILLDASVAEDPGVLAEVAQLDAPLQALREKVIGESSVVLDGERETCRFAECNLGDLITDAMVAATQSEGTEIAILNGGGIRSSIAAGAVSWGSVLEVLPFGNTTATFQLSGADVRLALENGVSRAENTENEGTGRFAQVSGLKYTWNPALPAGSRVTSVEVRQADGSYAPIDPARIYHVASNDYMRGGGDGYTVFAEKAIDAYDFGPVLADAVAAYIGGHSPVAPAVEGRVTLDETAAPETLPVTGAEAPDSQLGWLVLITAVLALGWRAVPSLR